MSLQNAEIESYLASGTLPEGAEVTYANAPGSDFTQTVHVGCAFQLSNLAVFRFIRLIFQDQSWTALSL